MVAVTAETQSADWGRRVSSLSRWLRARREATRFAGDMANGDEKTWTSLAEATPAVFKEAARELAHCEVVRALGADGEPFGTWRPPEAEPPETTAQGAVPAPETPFTVEVPAPQTESERLVSMLYGFGLGLVSHLGNIMLQRDTTALDAMARVIGLQGDALQQAADAVARLQEQASGGGDETQELVMKALTAEAMAKGGLPGMGMGMGAMPGFPGRPRPPAGPQRAQGRRLQAIVQAEVEKQIQQAIAQFMQGGGFPFGQSSEGTEGADSE